MSLIVSIRAFFLFRYASFVYTKDGSPPSRLYFNASSVGSVFLYLNRGIVLPKGTGDFLLSLRSFSARMSEALGLELAIIYVLSYAPGPGVSRLSLLIDARKSRFFLETKKLEDCYGYPLPARLCLSSEI